MMMLTNPAEQALTELTRVPWVRFAALALSSIFFLVDPFAAIGSFLAITSGAYDVRRKRMARKASLTCFIVLTSFALGGQLIFRMFGITLPAFEIAGGLILLLIGQVPTLWNWEMGAILGSIALTSLISYWVLAGASRVRRVMGETGIRILVRIMGLLLVALAMQFFVNGLTDLGVIAKP